MSRSREKTPNNKHHQFLVRQIGNGNLDKMRFRSINSFWFGNGLMSPDDTGVRNSGKNTRCMFVHLMSFFYVLFVLRSVDERRSSDNWRDERIAETNYVKPLISDWGSPVSVDLPERAPWVVHRSIRSSRVTLAVAFPAEKRGFTRTKKRPRHIVSVESAHNGTF